ncbi:helix-turn-helix domain-containing protein [Bacillus cereus]|nr:MULTISPECIES: helix-turn-helix domain-containing protein [Bacillus cereus group]MCC2369648.1 helix-turn-helix domain-containing protein [Bacillus cereus]MCC2397221.1 helix-turn-helix domain-containing protein [Bacillus cereus]MCC2414151.1 helix-turn-helix domain-containing protein [Bacillus paranthracis]MCC2448808.1 helix-turn-helix domain-containing protein [Bacillus cereus]MCC2461730.1 helix-turn-helix domain-containing protein [Bacillus mobilis]
MESVLCQKMILPISFYMQKVTNYHYAKQNKIRKMADPHRLHREARYYKEEVDRLASEREQYPTGMRPSEVAKQLGLSVQSVYKYIKDGTIKAVEVPFGDERTNYVISEEAFLEVKDLFQSLESERIRKNEYYDSNYDIALFQYFQSQDSRVARVMKDEELNWGFYLPYYQKWVEFNEGIEKYGLEPCYEIHKDALDYKGYVYIEIPKGEDILYPFIDFLYESWGIENVGIREQEQGVYISMKAGEISLQHSISFNLDQLIPFIKEGTVEIAEGLFIVRSAYRKTNLELPINMLDEAKQLAEKKNLTMSQWVEQVIQQALQMGES